MDERERQAARREEKREKREKRESETARAKDGPAGVREKQAEKTEPPKAD